MNSSKQLIQNTVHRLTTLGSTNKTNNRETINITPSNTTRNIMKQEMRSTDDETGRQKREWASFFVQAKKSSRKKKKRINLAKTIKKRDKEMAIQHWLKLYYKRHESDDDNREFTAAKIPSGAWGRVD